MVTEKHSDLSGLTLAIVRTLDDAGLDSASLLRELGMNPDGLGSADCRFSQEQVTQLWQKAEESTGDTSLGLKAAKHMRPANLHVVGHAMSCSASLKQALQRFIRFRRLLSDSAVMDLSETDDGYLYALKMENLDTPPAYQGYDFCLASLIILFRWIMGDAGIAPTKVCFKHSRPLDDTLYRDLFQCPVEFDQPCTYMSLPKELMERPIATGNEEVAVLLDDLAAQQISRRLKGNFAQQVRSALITLLPKGEPSKAAVAEIFKLSNRTLLRRLHDEYTTYQEVLDQLREEMAYGYLKRADVSLDETSNLLGFSDVSTFSRAFKRWTGNSPGLWRAQSSQWQTA